jgi:acyl carrier protein
MELEDRYGIRVSEEEAAEITTVGDAVDFVCARVPAGNARVLRGNSRGATR